jgi:hypothetical protein
MQSEDYHELPDDAFNTPPAPLPEGFAIVSTQPPPDPDFKQSGGRFLKGHDPRRHKFTAAECSRGFWTAISVWGVGIGEKLHAAGRWPTYRQA